MTTKQRLLIAAAIGCLTIAFMLKVLIGARNQSYARFEEQHRSPQEPTSIIEYTYKGHLYVKFDVSGNGAWGGHAGHCTGIHN